MEIKITPQVLLIELTGLTYLVDMKGQKMLGAFRRDILLGTDEIENDKELPEKKTEKGVVML